MARRLLILLFMFALEGCAAGQTVGPATQDVALPPDPTPETASGQDATGAVGTASTGVVQPEDPSQVGLAPYPDLPLDASIHDPMSVTYLIEHRSALNGQVVNVQGIVVATLLGEKACPPDMGMCAQPSVFLADTPDPGRDPLYDLRVLVMENAAETDFPVGTLIVLRVQVSGEATGVVALLVP